VVEHLQQSFNNSFPITGIGRYLNSSFRIIGRVAFAISQFNSLIGRVTTLYLERGGVNFCDVQIIIGKRGKILGDC